MSKLKLFVLCLAIFLMPSCLLALTTEQRQVLEKIEDRIEITGQMIGNFSQKKTIPQLPRPLISKGVVAVSDDLGISWRIESPVSSHRIFWNPDNNNGKGSSTDPIDNQITYPLLQIIKGNFSSLNDLFYLNAQIEQEYWRVSLIPKQKSFREIITSLEISGNHHVRKIIIAETNRAITELEISDFYSINQEKEKFLAEFSENK
ncbi:LolA family protein [Microbulbifer spongiae]|uniref:Outer membrane lipoprotein carrier protein LolA n=1 Tax=Microbulbifer spongiae TaxID=2944933 RepID=A0ABY9ECZ4_9GAMM|nr:outer membrane lipoprotein carrier protein LolA [Microbulbifer sp. MI-G]WKD49938.1 outer membrane lipoprotein carrier protein LolA [Microbulbifer sp. MI-G]